MIGDLMIFLGGVAVVMLFKQIRTLWPKTNKQHDKDKDEMRRKLWLSETPKKDYYTYLKKYRGMKFSRQKKRSYVTCNLKEMGETPKFIPSYEKKKFIEYMNKHEFEITNHHIESYLLGRWASHKLKRVDNSKSTIGRQIVDELLSDINNCCGHITSYMSLGKKPHQILKEKSKKKYREDILTVALQIDEFINDDVDLDVENQPANITKGEHIKQTAIVESLKYKVEAIERLIESGKIACVEESYINRKLNDRLVEYYTSRKENAESYLVEQRDNCNQFT